MRPLLLQTCSRSDLYPLLGAGTNGTTGPNAHRLIRGRAPATPTVKGRTMPTAPDWFRDTYTSIFDQQQATD